MSQKTEEKYTLSASLIGHESDVKAITFPHSDTIASGSRDGSTRLWKFGERDAENVNIWNSSVLYHETPYINSIGWLDADDQSLVVSGDQKGSIFASLPLEGADERLEPLYYLLGHESNVCALDSKHGLIVSGSWDKTARVWEGGKLKYVLKGHSQAVWCVAILSKSLILTGSADKTIRLWKDGEFVKEFAEHTDAVRGLDIISDSMFVSCSNDASLRIWSLDSDKSLQELYGHTSFIYSVKVLPNGDIVSSGEDRSVRIWRNGEVIQVITLPCISLWSVAVNSDTGDFAVGGSDHIIRVFSRDTERFAPEAEIKKLEETVANSAIGKDQMSAINKEELSGPEGLEVNGKKEGEIKMIRAENNTVIAYQWSEGTWVKIGEVIGQGNSSSKKTYQGKEYDYVFDVDVQEGAPALKLPYNLTENPYDAARRFLEANELPANYLDQVAQFITTNSEGVDLTNQAPATSPYGSRYIPGGESTSTPTPKTTVTKTVQTKVVPVENYVTLVAFQPAPIAKAVRTFNAKQDTANQLNEIELGAIEPALSSLNSETAKELYSIASKIISTWDVPSMLPAFDILRIVIPHLSSFAPVALVQQLLSCMDANVPKHCLLAIRGLVNLFACPNPQAIGLVDNATTRSTVFGTISELLQNGVSSTPSNIAIASLALNYAVRTYGKRDNPAAASTAADLLLKQLLSFYPSFSDGESRYRLFLAVGTLLTVAGPQGRAAVTGFIKSNEIDLSEQRLKDVAADIQALVAQ
ncbi:hypothetical protein DV451_003717 [Geotrichum candidum]|uniref:PFU domain-containing protein n=1 Tax=Geotrichum candidum TaxID=1173061 RepID=A0A9P5G4K3_GEOCN|nr:hypothetical protein DV451_003717 [Geotrichum candidum]KAF5110859.1 hypothetical protein DV453_000560 [Geotrichum candidum]